LAAGAVGVVRPQVEEAFARGLVDLRHVPLAGEAVCELVEDPPVVVARPGLPAFAGEVPEPQVDRVVDGDHGADDHAF
jgi:hypothetical protein